MSSIGRCARCRAYDHCFGQDDNCYCPCVDQQAHWDGPGCATCGCMQPENKHGDERNITASEFKAASTATRVAPGSTAKALSNTRKTLRKRK